MNFVTFASELIKVRVENNITQRRLAKLLGCSYNSVWRWENGINKPRLTTRYRLEKKIEDLRARKVIV